MSNSFSARLIITVISLAILTFMGIFSETSLAIVSPHLMEEFHVSAVAVQWLTSGFLLLLAVAIPLSPFLVKTISTKLLFKFAVIIFITGTIMGAFASNFTMLLLGRLIMAVGTGCSLPLLTNIVLEETTPYQRGTLLGIVGLVVSFAPVSGPVLGGLIAEYLGWRWVFLFMLPILVVSFIMGSTSIRDIRKGEVYHLDVKSFLISSAGLVSFIMGLSYLSTKYGILLICISFVFLGIFILLQLKVKYPLMNIKILKYKMFTLGLITVCMPMASVLALSFLIPILAQMGLGKNALQASFIMLPGTLFSGMLAPVMGAKYSKFGVRRLLIPGFIIMCLSMFYLVFTETTYISSIIGYICFMTGAAFCQVPAQTNALNALPQQYNADGTAILSTLQQTAGAAGTALASVLLSYGAKKAYNSGIDNIYVYGINYGFMLCLVFVLVGLFAAFQLKTTLEKENV
ncbi:MAG: DHA2 family efflux MFS transporter permease subunit [Mucispirillum sp.]|nr:DHA2 family efflux MFS transporter permease subunit [Mucispirillum sp.]